MFLSIREARPGPALTVVVEWSSNVGCISTCPKANPHMARLTEGDHIKVTASRYPFPTVCADKQSTDWFHAIGRTLKW